MLETERATLTERIRAMDEAGLEVQPDTDPEARVMRHGHVGYNVQSSVDGKHRLIVDVDVVQSAADQDQLYRMARRSQRQLQENKMQVLADSGYSSGWHFKRCQAHGLTPYVPVNRSINNHGDGGLFDKSAFSYHADGDYYECPAGEPYRRRPGQRRIACTSIPPKPAQAAGSGSVARQGSSVMCHATSRRTRSTRSQSGPRPTR